MTVDVVFLMKIYLFYIFAFANLKLLSVLDAFPFLLSDRR